MYDIHGVTPDYNPPQKEPAIDSHIVKSVKYGRPRNFVRQNLRIMHTGVSSPLKGAPLLNK